MSADPRYSERQYFRQDWLWALLLIGSLPAAVLASVAVATDADPGTNVPLVIGAIQLLVFSPLVAFYYANLRLTVREDGLTLRLWPLHLRARQVDCGAITAVTVTEISPMGDFGGVGIRLNPTIYRWGIRFDGPLGYVVEGKRAVRIERESGRTLVVTSVDPHALASELDRVCGSVHNHNR